MITPNEFSKLKSAVADNNLSSVKSFFTKYGKSIFELPINEDGPQKIYPDLYTYYPIHIAVQNHAMDILKFLAENGISHNVVYTIESDFNSRADQYMKRETKDINQWAQYCGASREIVDFLSAWRLNH